MKTHKRIYQDNEDIKHFDEWFNNFLEMTPDYQEQIHFLEEFGMSIPNPSKTYRQLECTGFSTLKHFFFSCLTENDNQVFFQKGTSWDIVYNRYKFNKKLSSLLLEIIGDFEIALQEQIAYQLEQAYGGYWINDPSLFKEAKFINLNDQIIRQDIFEDTQKSIKRYHKQDTLCSFRSCSKIFSFSEIYRIYSHLKDRTIKDSIARYFDLPYPTFCSWLYTSIYIRNLCAHNQWIWNRVLQVVPEELPYYCLENKDQWISNCENIERNKIYYILCILNFLSFTIDSEKEFIHNLMALLKEYKMYISFSDMGFPENWKQEKIWQIDY